MTLIIKYPLDLHASNPTNYVFGERHTLPAGSNRLFALDYGPFYTKDLVVRDRATGQTLTRGTQWKAVQLEQNATLRSGFEVCCAIVVTDPTVSNQVEVDARYVGGEFSASTDAIVQLIQSANLNGGPVAWGMIIGVPTEFTPADHFHDIDSTYGWNYMVEAAWAVRDAILNRDQVAFDEVYKYIDEQIAAIGGGGDLAAHIADKNNPHAVTKAQVQLGNVPNWSTPSKAQAESGTADNLFMNPLRTKEAVLYHLVQHTNTPNPHNITKITVQLGNVNNYGTATPLQAAAGKAANLHTTPQGISAALRYMGIPAGLDGATPTVNHTGPDNALPGGYNVPLYSMAPWIKQAYVQGLDYNQLLGIGWYPGIVHGSAVNKPPQMNAGSHSYMMSLSQLSGVTHRGIQLAIDIGPTSTPEFRGMYGRAFSKPSVEGDYEFSAWTSVGGGSGSGGKPDYGFQVHNDLVPNAQWSSLLTVSRGAIMASTYDVQLVKTEATNTYLSAALGVSVPAAGQLPAGEGALASNLTLPSAPGASNPDTYHYFVVRMPNGSIKIGADIVLDAANLRSSNGVTHWRWIASVPARWEGGNNTYGQLEFIRSSGPLNRRVFYMTRMVGTEWASGKFRRRGIPNMGRAYSATVVGVSNNVIASQKVQLFHDVSPVDSSYTAISTDGYAADCTSVTVELNLMTNAISKAGASRFYDAKIHSYVLNLQDEDVWGGGGVVPVPPPPETPPVSFGIAESPYPTHSVGVGIDRPQDRSNVVVYDGGNQVPIVVNSTSQRLTLRSVSPNPTILGTATGGSTLLSGPTLVTLSDIKVRVRKSGSSDAWTPCTVHAALDYSSIYGYDIYIHFTVAQPSTTIDGDLLDVQVDSTVRPGGMLTTYTGVYLIAPVPPPSIHGFATTFPPSQSTPVSITPGTSFQAYRYSTMEGGPYGFKAGGESGEVNFTSMVKAYVRSRSGSTLGPWVQCVVNSATGLAHVLAFGIHQRCNFTVPTGVFSPGDILDLRVDATDIPANHSVRWGPGLEVLHEGVLVVA